MGIALAGAHTKGQKLQKFISKHEMKMAEVVSGYKKNCFKIIFNKRSVANGQFKSQTGKISTFLYAKRSCKKRKFI